MDWIYLASGTQTDLPSTLQAVTQNQLLWRPARNSRGALIANIAHLRVGHHIVLAWRADRRAYLCCRIAPPNRPIEVDGRRLAVDRIAADEADGLAALGYQATGDGIFEAIRFDEVEECCFPLQGRYAGNNSLHKIEECDDPSVREVTRIPPSACDVRPDRASRVATVAEVRPTADRCAVDAVRLHGGAAERAFDAYVMVDWSSSSRPTTGNDSIWVASGSWQAESFTAGAPENIPTRHAAVERIRHLARTWKDEGRRVLVGMDFAFGYPAGFADALGLDTRDGAWRAVHQHIAHEVSDGADNRHNRDGFADACNQRIAPAGPGPFWACTAAAVTPHLTQQRQGIFRFPYAGALEEWRTTERRAAARTVTQPVWKLNCGVSVGGQTIVGIKHLHALTQAQDARCWPFDTGWTAPAPGDACVWFAEIFPSLVRYAEWSGEYDRQRDRTQVQSCVRRAAEEDAGGKLAERFCLPAGLTALERTKVEQEEGWILWV